MGAPFQNNNIALAIKITKIFLISTLTFQAVTHIAILILENTNLINHDHPTITNIFTFAVNMLIILSAIIGTGSMGIDAVLNLKMIKHFDKKTIPTSQSKLDNSNSRAIHDEEDGGETTEGVVFTPAISFPRQILTNLFSNKLYLYFALLLIMDAILISTAVSTALSGQAFSDVILQESIEVGLVINY